MAITQKTDMDGESFDTDQCDTAGNRDPPLSRQESTTDVGGSEAETSTCPECSGKIVTEGHERVCTACGLVIEEDAVDHGPEWRNFDDTRDDPRRAAPINTTHHDNGIGTQGFRPDGGVIDQQTQRMAEVSSWREDKQSRSLRACLTDIKRASTALDASKAVRNIGCKLFKQFFKSENHAGHSLDEMIAATLYAACRIYDAGITGADVAAQLDVSRSRVYRELPRLKEAVDTPIPIETPSDFVPRFVADLGGSPQTETFARQLAAEIEDRELLVGSGCKPSGIAATVVYIAFRANPDESDHTQDEVGEVANVSDATIRSNKEKIKNSSINVSFDGATSE